MPRDEHHFDVYIPDKYLKWFNEIEEVGKNNEIKKARMICRAVRDYVDKNNFDSIKLIRYLSEHPEDIPRIREILDNAEK